MWQKVLKPLPKSNGFNCSKMNYGDLYTNKFTSIYIYIYIYIYICVIHMIYAFIYPGFTTFRKCEKKPFTQNVFYLKWTKYFSRNCGFDFLAFAKINNVCLFNNSLFLPYNSLYLCLIWIRVLKHLFPNPKDVAEYLVTSLLQGIRY